MGQQSWTLAFLLTAAAPVLVGGLSAYAGHALRRRESVGEDAEGLSRLGRAAFVTAGLLILLAGGNALVAYWELA